jgi:hypothetical protein
MFDKPSLPLTLSSTHQQSFYQSTTAFSSQQQQQPPVPSSSSSSSFSIKAKTDFHIAFKELNSFLQFKNHDLGNEYILYNLNTKSIFFMIFFVLLVTCILLPVKIIFLSSSLYAIINIHQTFMISSSEIIIMFLIHFLMFGCLLIMSFITMKYIHKRYYYVFRSIKRWCYSCYEKCKYWFCEGILWICLKCCGCCCCFLSLSSEELDEEYHGSTYSQRFIHSLQLKVLYLEHFVKKQRLRYVVNVKDEEEARGVGGMGSIGDSASDSDSDDDDDTNVVNSDEDDVSSPVNRSAKSISFSSHTYYQREEKHSEIKKKQQRQEKTMLTKDFLFFQQLFIFSLICYNILIVINTFIRFNCIDYDSSSDGKDTATTATPFSMFFHNCYTSNETVTTTDDRPMFSRSYIYSLIFIPLVISHLFRESLFKIQLCHHIIVLSLTISLAIFYDFYFYEILLFVIWLIGGIFLLIDLHIHNVASFLTSYHLKQLLSDHEKAIDNIHALEMRHMIGNVAHDLKTVRFSFCFLLLF